MNQKLESEDSHPPSGLIAKIKKFLEIPFHKNTICFRSNRFLKRCCRSKYN